MRDTNVKRTQEYVGHLSSLRHAWYKGEALFLNSLLIPMEPFVELKLKKMAPLVK
jgi:hypothetical protein